MKKKGSAYTVIQQRKIYYFVQMERKGNSRIMNECTPKNNNNIYESIKKKEILEEAYIGYKHKDESH